MLFCLSSKPFLFCFLPSFAADDLFKRWKIIIIKIFMLLFILDFVLILSKIITIFIIFSSFFSLFGFCFFIKTLGKQYRWCQIIISLQLGIYH